MRKTINRTILACVMVICVLTLAPAAGDGPAFAASKAPGKVTGLHLQVSAQPTATLQWKAAGKNIDGYVVYRNGRRLAKVKKGATAYVDRSLKPGASYSYTVRAFNKTSKKTFLGKPSSAKKIVNGYTWGKADDGKAIVEGYTGHEGDVSIPPKLGGKKVTEIGAEAFQGNLFIRNLKIPEGVKQIDDYAFEACSGVRKIYFPKSLKYIGDGAFSGCAQMRIADLSDGVAHIGNGAFLYCMNLASIELPADLSELGDFAFAGTGISKVWFNGEKLTKLPDRVFCNCSRLTSIVIPGNVTSIGKRAFSGCSRLDTAEFAGEKIGISDYAFESCDILKPFFSSCVPDFGKQIFSSDKEQIKTINEKITFPDDVFIVKEEEADDSGDIDFGNLVYPISIESIEFTSETGSESFLEDQHADYLNIEEGFDAWVEKYKEYNKDLPMTAEYNPYLSLYTGEEHYRQMKAVLNHDAGRWAYAVKYSGDDFAPMYLMMDHGLSAELCRGKMPQDLVLFSGLKSEQVACFAGHPQGERNVTVSREKLVSLIGTEVADEAFMSTTASASTAIGFAEEPANVMVRIYASQEAMDHLGAVCVAPFSVFSSEKEVLFNSFARYTVLDVGKVTIRYNMSDGSTTENSKTCLTLELK